MKNGPRAKPLKRASRGFPSGPLHGSVVLNFRRAPASDFGPYAGAFHRAGLTLLAKLRRSRGYRDTDACPIVVALRMSLELFMKGVIVSGERLLWLSGKSLPIDRDILKEHRLTPLVPALAAVFSEAGWEWSLDVRNFESPLSLTRYLTSLEAVDPLSFSFRYPTNKKGEGSLPHHFSFNVLAFADEIEPVLRILDGAITGLKSAA